jgi:arylsulfatase A-like enzyme
MLTNANSDHTSSWKTVAVLCRSVFVSLTALAFAALAEPVSAEQRPNIVLILADDLGWTGLGCFGSDFYETPHIDRLAAQGMRFTCGFAPMMNCAPSRASIMSGQYTPRHRVMFVSHYQNRWKQRQGNLKRFKLLQPDKAPHLSNSTLTVAESLKKAGYVTAMFGKWHLGPKSTQHPSMRGFDEAIESAGKHFGFSTHPEVEHDPDQYLSDFLCDRALAFIERSHRAGKPFFLYQSDFLVHGPFETKPKLLAHFEAKAKGKNHHSPVAAAMIKALDDSVGRIATKLDELGIADNTLLIFTSDNGGLGYPEDGKRPNCTSNLPLRGQKGSEFDGGTRVPFIFRWPGRIPAGTLSHEPIHGVDLYPTILELAGAPRPQHVLDGVSLIPVLRDPKATVGPRELYWYYPMYSSFNRPSVSVRRGEWKLIHLFDSGQIELYNTAEDIGETRNRAGDHPELAAELNKLALKWLDDTDAPRMRPNPDYEPDARGRR